MFELIDLIIINPIVNILFAIYNFVGDFGIAIILFTILVKILVWPLVKRQMHHTKLMRKIQPELAEIKKRCKGNRQLESIQMLDLYKRNNIKPFRSILTMLIQIPIFIALFTSISVIVSPTTKSNVASRAYSFTSSMERIDYIIQKQKSYLKDPKTPYDFKPQLLNTVDLSARAGFNSISSITILLFATLSALTQYFVSKQLNPTSTKGAGFKKMLQDASSGKDPSQADMNVMISRQMTIMMPLMMFFIAISLPGAIVFYYLLISLISLVQQKIILNQTEEEMEISADKSIIKELNKIKEAEVIQNKKTGTRITRISAKNQKKSTSSNKRRKHE